MTEQTEVGNDLHSDIDKRAKGTKEDDHPKPIHIGPATNEVKYRQCLQNEAPWVKERNESHIPRQPIPSV
jgi:hypothetical protein